MPHTDYAEKLHQREEIGATMTGIDPSHQHECFLIKQVGEEEASSVVPPKDPSLTDRGNSWHQALLSVTGEGQQK